MPRIKSTLSAHDAIQKFILLNNFERTHKRRGKRVLFEFQSHLIGFAAYAPYVHHFHSLGYKCYLGGFDNPVGSLKTLKLKFYSMLMIDKIEARPFYLFRRMKFAKMLVVFAKKGARLKTNNFTAQYIGASKTSILEMKFEGILIGDLFYDWHLRKRGLATLETSSIIFSKDLAEFIQFAYNWNSYLRKKKFDFMVVTHAVYLQGLISRISCSLGSEVFLVTPEKMFHLSSELPLSDLEPRLYKTDQEIKLHYDMNPENAKLKLQQLMSGSKNVDIAHSFVNGMSGEKTTRIIEGDANVKILIAAHCFSDSPHTNGLHLFPDFMEWLEWLALYSKESSFDWFIKAHPAFFPSDVVFLDEYCARNPHIRYVSSEYSNRELVDQGINVVLTVYGTIAFEMAYLGVLVVNASESAPHSNYSFSLSPRSIPDYKSTLDNLKELTSNLQIDKNDIFHFYDLHHLRRNYYWLFGATFHEITNEFGVNYSEPLEIFGFYLELLENPSYVTETTRKISNFIKSESYVYHANF